VYLILAFVTVPFFGFVVPRVTESLHPENTLISDGMVNIGGEVAFIFLSSLFCFLCVYLWVFSIGCRILRLEQDQLERSYGN
jgi:heme exporter protein C